MVDLAISASKKGIESEFEFLDLNREVL